MIFDPSKFQPQPSSNVLYYDQNYNVKISNNYVVLPVLIRNYFGKKGVYWQGGFYAGYLLKSQVSVLEKKHAYIPNYDSYGYDFLFRIDNQVDSKKQLTTNFDFGISIGAGISHALTNRIYLNANLICNVGLRKIDGKYDNEYSSNIGSTFTGITTIVRSTNYYGLNSEAKNINMAVTVGLGYRLK